MADEASSGEIRSATWTRKTKRQGREALPFRRRGSKSYFFAFSSAFIEPPAGVAGIAGAAAVVAAPPVAGAALTAELAELVLLLIIWSSLATAAFFLAAFFAFFVAFLVDSCFIESDFIEPDEAAGGVVVAGAGVCARAKVDVAAKAPAMSVARSLFMDILRVVVG